LPHVSTFGEVVRTTMVRAAFALLSDIPAAEGWRSMLTDGFRKV
jgi:lysyl-tRNA synthetase class 1